MKEVNFKRCFVNGKKCGVASYDDDTRRVLYFSQSLGAGVGVEDLRAAGVSCHQFNNSWVIPSPDAAGIQSLIPGAVVIWDGSKEYQTLSAAAVGTRGGGKTSSAAAEDTPATGFVVPSVDDVPAVVDVLKMMPALRADYESAGNDFAGVLAAAVDPSDISDLEITATDKITAAAAFAPAVGDALKIYGGIIVGAFRAWLDAEKKRKEEEEKRVKEEEEKRIAAEKAAAAAADGKTLVTLADGSSVAVTGRVHPAFAEVFEDLRDFKRVYLHGPAGTGKSFMARQLAEALGVECYISGKADLKYDLIGTHDASGKHIPTAFTLAAMHGGVWLWDEVDRSADDACTAINDGLANGKIFIPGVGMVELHKNFYVIAAGNTCGFGASQKYSSAQKQDFSVLTRFLSKIEIGYCREMDMIVTNDDAELCDFAGAVREAIKQTGIEIDLPIRALMPLKNKAARRGYRRALECCLFAGVGSTQIKQIATRVIGSGVWFDALQELADAV